MQAHRTQKQFVQSQGRNNYNATSKGLWIHYGRLASRGFVFIARSIKKFLKKLQRHYFDATSHYSNTWHLLKEVAFKAKKD